MSNLYAAARRLRETGGSYALVKYGLSLDEALTAHPLLLSSAAGRATRKHAVGDLKNAENAYRSVSALFDAARSRATWREIREAWLLCPESDTFLRPKIWDGDARQLDAYAELLDAS